MLEIKHLELRELLLRRDSGAYFFRLEGKTCSEPETWTIDVMIGEDDLCDSFLYESKHEYDSDVHMLSEYNEEVEKEL